MNLSNNYKNINSWCNSYIWYLYINFSNTYNMLLFYLEYIFCLFVLLIFLIKLILTWTEFKQISYWFSLYCFMQLVDVMMGPSLYNHIQLHKWLMLKPFRTTHVLSNLCYIFLHIITWNSSHKGLSSFFGCYKEGLYDCIFIVIS